MTFKKMDFKRPAPGVIPTWCIDEHGEQYLLVDSRHTEGLQWPSTYQTVGIVPRARQTTDIYFTQVQIIDRIFSVYVGTPTGHSPDVLPFPQKPTIPTLQKLAGKIIEGECYVVAQDGRIYCQWQGLSLIDYMPEADDSITLRYRPGLDQNPSVLDAYKLMTGGWFNFETRNGIVGLSGGSLPGWIPFWGGLTINVQTGKGNLKEGENILENLDRAKQKVSRYVDSFNLNSFQEIASFLTDKQAILTRCPGCQTLDIVHLSVHMARQEVTPFLIFSFFGGGVDGEKATRAYLRQILAGKASLESIKSAAENFLNQCLYPKSLFYDPKLSITSSPWRVRSQKRFADTSASLDSSFLHTFVKEGKLSKGHPPNKTFEVQVNPGSINVWSGDINPQTIVHESPDPEENVISVNPSLPNSYFDNWLESSIHGSIEEDDINAGTL